MRDLHYRVGGVICLIGTIGSTLVHRSIYEGARRGPAQIAEFAAGLVTFTLACLGILLLIHGARLFGRSNLTASTPVLHGDRNDHVLEGHAQPGMVALDSRDGVALVLARRTIAAAADRKPYTPIADRLS